LKRFRINRHLASLKVLILRVEAHTSQLNNCQQKKKAALCNGA
jgi:hypothetical protein